MVTRAVARSRESATMKEVVTTNLQKKVVSVSVCVCLLYDKFHDILLMDSVT